ncbi:MAG: hypothetical protein L7U83_03330 [Akkermansiaceae bacterium]|nr:hypothetical protein [Akkermansiaceae bacterium]
MNSTESHISTFTRLHDSPVAIVRNNFKHKSLSDWSLNLHVGCMHRCRFCFCPSVNVQQNNRIKSHGVADPVNDWGSYLLVRPWNEKRFRASLLKAENTPLEQLSHDGNRAIMASTMTDPYQVIRERDLIKQRRMQDIARSTRRRALESIRDHSTLNVRLLTRSPFAREDFEIMKSFGSRLLLGSSIPTLDTKLARFFEPNAPAPKQRLKLLRDAHAAGIHTFAAVAPVYPGTTLEELVTLFEELRACDPVTNFMEPINLRLGIVQKIQSHAKEIGFDVDLTPFETPDQWAPYAISSLRMAETAAREAGVLDRLHLWPDKALGASKIISAQDDPESYRQWLSESWNMISSWPR